MSCNAVSNFIQVCLNQPSTEPPSLSHLHICMHNGIIPPKTIFGKFLSDDNTAYRSLNMLKIDTNKSICLMAELRNITRILQQPLVIFFLILIPVTTIFSSNRGTYKWILIGVQVIEQVVKGERWWLYNDIRTTHNPHDSF